MSSSAENGGPPLSIRPVPIANESPKNISDFIARVNAQPGGFRVLNSKNIRAEIQSRKERGDDAFAIESESSNGDDEEDDSPKDPLQVRMEVLKNVDLAGNTAMMTLDSLSLLLSKQNPTQAAVTLSQDLREMVGIGTIGVDKLHESPTSAETLKDAETVALGWTLIEINKTKEAAEEASKFLQREMQLENTYWEDIIEVQTSGWSICKMPQDKSSLAVRFGFSEPIPDFQRSGLAPMRRGDDGRVQLDLGPLGRIPKRIRVTIEKNGKIVGQSALPAGADESTALQTRVLEARDTIFARELWHELVRESRQLLAYDTQLANDNIICNANPSCTIKLELADLDAVPSPDTSLSENRLAESLLMSLHLLLSYAHRYNELTRTRPMPPHIPRPQGQQTYALLRPIIARWLGSDEQNKLVAYIGSLTKALKDAGFSATFALKTSPLSWDDPFASTTNKANRTSSAQNLIRNLIQPSVFLIQVVAVPNAPFTISGRTILYPVTCTEYRITAPEGSKLLQICPPYKAGFQTFQAVREYINTAMSQSLAEHYLDRLRNVNLQDAGKESNLRPEWNRTVRGNTIRDFNKDGGELFFLLDSEGETSFVSTGCIDSRDGKMETKKWQWSGNEEVESEKVKKETMDEVVDGLVDKIKG